MASEDSDQISSGLSTVHRLRDLSNLDQPMGCEMQAGVDERHAIRELLEVLLLGGPHRMLQEERDDRLQQIHALAHHVAEHGLAMVVVPVVRYDTADSKEALELVQAMDALCALRHRELVRYLVPGSVAAAIFAIALPDESDREASFSVYETGDPADP